MFHFVEIYDMIFISVEKIYSIQKYCVLLAGETYRSYLWKFEHDLLEGINWEATEENGKNEDGYGFF